MKNGQAPLTTVGLLTIAALAGCGISPSSSVPEKTQNTIKEVDTYRVASDKPAEKPIKTKLLFNDELPKIAFVEFGSLIDEFNESCDRTSEQVAATFKAKGNQVYAYSMRKIAIFEMRINKIPHIASSLYLDN